MRGHLFTDRDRERLKAWLGSGVEDDGLRMLFVAVRRNLNMISGDVGLLARVARRLRAEGRWMGRARLPGRLGEIAREIEGKARIHGRRSESPYLLPETVVQEHVFLLDRGGVRL